MQPSVRLRVSGAGLVAIVLAGGLLSTPLAAQTAATREHFTALAIAPWIGAPVTPIDIVVERWSTPAERDLLMTAVIESKTKGAMAVLRKLPRVARFGATGMLGHQARFAWKEKGPDGIERITIATDRDIDFWEASAQPRSLDYPITIIELRLKPTGQGEGHVAVAAQLGYDKFRKMMIVENFDIQPIQLTSVRRLK